MKYKQNIYLKNDVNLHHIFYPKKRKFWPHCRYYFHLYVILSIVLVFFFIFIKGVRTYIKLDKKRTYVKLKKPYK